MTADMLKGKKEGEMGVNPTGLIEFVCNQLYLTYFAEA